MEYLPTSYQVFGKQQFFSQLFHTWAVIKTLVDWVIQGIIPPSYIGITISYFKDPHKPTRSMECHVRVLITAHMEHVGYRSQ